MLTQETTLRLTQVLGSCHAPIFKLVLQYDGVWSSSLRLAGKEEIYSDGHMSAEEAVVTVLDILHSAWRR